MSSWSSALFSRSNSSLAFKATHSKKRVLAHTLKVAILTSYKNVSVGYIELKLHIYALGTSETYFTSCKKGHNRSPLMLGCYCAGDEQCMLSSKHDAWNWGSSDQRILFLTVCEFFRCFFQILSGFSCVFTEERIEFGHTTIKTRLVECCSHVCPSVSFSHLHKWSWSSTRVTISFWSNQGPRLDLLSRGVCLSKSYSFKWICQRLTPLEV